MAIAGVVKDIGLPPIGAKDLDPKETFVPFHIELRNGRVTRAGNWGTRPGYGDGNSLDGSPVNFLFAKDGGIASTENGNVYKNVTTIPEQMTGTNLTGSGRPQADKFEDKTIIVDGGLPIKVSDGNTSLLEGSPPSAKYIGRVGAYTLLAGYSDTEFTWSAANNPENYTTGDSGTTNIKKDGVIKYATDFKEKWFVFKDNAIEIWHNRGGDTPFVRLNELTIPIGLGASYSVVEANQTLYWMDDDRKFRVLNGANAQLISGQEESYIFDKITYTENVYGIHFEKEHVIRWFSQEDCICLKYDYENQLWSEDNELSKGLFIEMPINSYMELDGEGYIGDLNSTGLVCRWSTDFKTDNGKDIAVMRKFRVKMSERDNRASANQLRFMFKRGEGVNGNKAEAFFWVRMDDNVYRESRIIDLGTINEKNPEVTFSRLGTGRQMEIEIWMTDHASFLLTGAKLTTKEMGR
jgi:hypothetical protein